MPYFLALATVLEIVVPALFSCLIKTENFQTFAVVITHNDVDSENHFTSTQYSTDHHLADDFYTITSKTLEIALEKANDRIDLLNWQMSINEKDQTVSILASTVDYDEMRLQIETNPPGIVRDRAFALLEHQREKITAGLAKERRIHAELLKQLHDAFKIRIMLEREIYRRALIAETKEKEDKEKRRDVACRGKSVLRSAFGGV